ncbi:GlcNAc-binding protein A [Paenibacillus sp. CECT 9249]|uniref:lytic polysaccharide monooxygenase n=1 Tax=Paenibacillus sp. CECT 9249 TaxID=2845385 RepID=UPI001E4E8948|nr:lytic polysaccharide monooxygenase [Paenibacillus sp. CECT 9249]CAH0121755.1 GlcNAc-binding protein A [Paenibacillus sp. CECT 9249]
MVHQVSLNEFVTKWKMVFIIAGTMLLTMILSLAFAESASAHGYVDSPASRGYLCKLGQNTNCGAVQYDPHSLEGPKGFPQAGPADGKIASANGLFPEMDQQTATRWTKVNMSSGNNTFHWTLTAAHATTSWKYYITKPDWNPNEPLKRASFDLTPFCSFNDGGQRPPNSVTHSCNVPSRSGYHVILAVWEIADTANAFYNVIDANFGGGSGDNQPPTAPTNLRTTGVTANSVSLAWNASTDNVGVTGYQVYRGTNLAATVSGSTLSYTVTGLASNTSYSFTVRAVDAAGNVSNASNSVSATTSGPTPDTDPPTAPANLRVTGTSASSVSLAWNASTDNVGVTGYQVFRGSTLVATVSGSSLSYTVAGLASSTTYSFTVRAVDAGGNVSGASNAVSATTNSSSEAPAWAPGVQYSVGALVTYGGNVYECRQAHTSLTGWEPPNVPALWLLK